MSQLPDKSEYSENEVRRLLLGAKITNVRESMGGDGNVLTLRLDSGHTVKITAKQLHLSAQAKKLAMTSAAEAHLLIAAHG